MKRKWNKRKRQNGYDTREYGEKKMIQTENDKKKDTNRKRRTWNDTKLNDTKENDIKENDEKKMILKKTTKKGYDNEKKTAKRKLYKRKL